VYCISRLRFSDIGGMAEVDEQRVCIKFCVRLGKTGSETFEMLKQAFGDSCMSRSRTFEWYYVCHSLSDLAHITKLGSLAPNYNQNGS
jgi:hypothetical protein